MTDGEALLRAILENPADDTARLVYADWLEENKKGKWAEFVRREVARAPDNESDAPQVCVWSKPSLVDYYWGADGKTSLWRRGEIREACSLLPPLPAGDDYPDWHASFRRGFVAEIHLPLAAFLAHAESLFRAHPVTRVVLADREPGRSIDLDAWFWRERAPLEGESLPDLVGYMRRDAVGLPPGLFRRLPDWRDPPAWVSRYPVPAGVSCYRTKGDASEALSAACAAYGRSLAGLPPLPAEAAAWA